MGLDGHYRTIADRSARAIGGLSTGGYCGINLTFRHQDVFSAAVSHSGYGRPDQNRYTGNLFGGNRALAEAERTRPVPRGDPSAAARRLHGRRGSSDRESRRESAFLFGVLHPRGVTVAVNVVKGESHNFVAWRQNLNLSLPWVSERFAAGARDRWRGRRGHPGRLSPAAFAVGPGAGRRPGLPRRRALVATAAGAGRRRQRRRRPHHVDVERRRPPRTAAPRRPARAYDPARPDHARPARATGRPESEAVRPGTVEAWPDSLGPCAGRRRSSSPSSSSVRGAATVGRRPPFPPAHRAGQRGRPRRRRRPRMLALAAYAQLTRAVLPPESRPKFTRAMRRPVDPGREPHRAGRDGRGRLPRLPAPHRAGSGGRRRRLRPGHAGDRVGPRAQRAALARAARHPSRSRLRPLYATAGVVGVLLLGRCAALVLIFGRGEERAAPRPPCAGPPQPFVKPTLQGLVQRLGGRASSWPATGHCWPGRCRVGDRQLAARRGVALGVPRRLRPPRPRRRPDRVLRLGQCAGRHSRDAGRARRDRNGPDVPTRRVRHTTRPRPSSASSPSGS